jgi:hypothetical protein
MGGELSHPQMMLVDWFVDSFLNEGGGRVKVRFRVVDFNLLCGIEGVALINQQKP